MKILSKYKDYYDYLQGVWGSDPKLVLDRRTEELHRKEDLYSSPRPFSSERKGKYVAIGINDKVYTGVYIFSEDKFYYGEELNELAESTGYNSWHDKKWMLKWRSDNYQVDENYVEVVLGKDRFGRLESYDLNTQPITKIGLNTRFNCPIVIYNSQDDFDRLKNPYKFPILKELEFARVLPPEEVFREISDWLSKRITQKEIQREGILTNKEKIEAKGFDAKRSFRPNMKK